MSLDPRFDKPTQEPKFYLDAFDCEVFDEDGKSYPAKVEYESAFYDGAIRVYSCTVLTNYRHVIQDDIYEALRLRHGKNVSFECEINFV